MQNPPHWIKTISNVMFGELYFLRCTWLPLHHIFADIKVHIFSVYPLNTKIDKINTLFKLSCDFLFFYDPSFYKKVPGQETMVRVIFPLSSLSILAKQACIIPDVLLPFTARRMSPHLKQNTQSKVCGYRFDPQLKLIQVYLMVLILATSVYFNYIISH